MQLLIILFVNAEQKQTISKRLLVYNPITASGIIKGAKGNGFSLEKIQLPVDLYPACKTVTDGSKASHLCLCI